MSTHASFYRPAWLLLICALLAALALPHAAHASEVENTRRLAAQGDAGAQFNLGLMYFRGAGVFRNLVNAHMWANLAAAQGNSGAADTRERIAQQMSPAQLAQAQRRASACLAANYRNC